MVGKARIHFGPNEFLKGHKRKYLPDVTLFKWRSGISIVDKSGAQERVLSGDALLGVQGSRASSVWRCVAWSCQYEIKAGAPMRSS